MRMLHQAFAVAAALLVMASTACAGDLRSADRPITELDGSDHRPIRITTDNAPNGGIGSQEKNGNQPAVGPHYDCLRVGGSSKDGLMARSRKLPIYRHYRVLFEAGSFSGLSDGELLDRFLNRDSEAAELAFESLVERHGPMVLRICRAVIRNEHDAEDAFQATFLVLATKAARLHVRDSLGPWLVAVARRVARGARAAAIGRQARERRAADEGAKRSDQNGDGEDVASVLYEEIDLLPERYRLPVVLCDLESQTHQEAALRLGWPLGTVKSRQARGRQRLRARLSRRGLSGTFGPLPAAFAVKSAPAAIPDALVEATARAAARFVSSGTAAKTVSASVSTLVTNTLRAMIMLRLSKLMAILLTVSVGVAATVVAQSDRRPSGTEKNVTPAVLQAPPTARWWPVIEYEIAIWKDGAPYTERVKVRAVQGETVHLKVPEGSVDIRFQPRIDAAESVDLLSRRESRPIDPRPTPAPGTEQPQVAPGNSFVDPTKKAEPLDRVMVSRETERTGTTAGVGREYAAWDRSAVNNHEQRLREIERKLERILSALERPPASGSETAKNAPPK